MSAEPTQQQPIAQWRSDLDCWVHVTEGQLFELLVVFSETFPTSGMTVAGTAYALPTSAPRTDGSGCSLLPDLLPTPDAYAGSRGGSQDPAKRRAGGHQPTIADVVEHSFPPRPLMTPRT